MLRPTSRFTPHRGFLPVVNLLHPCNPASHLSLPFSLSGALPHMVCSPWLIHYTCLTPLCTTPILRGTPHCRCCLCFDPVCALPHVVGKYHFRVHSNGMKSIPDFIHIFPAVLKLYHAGRQAETPAHKVFFAYTRVWRTPEKGKYVWIEHLFETCRLGSRGRKEHLQHLCLDFFFWKIWSFFTFYYYKLHVGSR
jgi:hypothetical protein